MSPHELDNAHLHENTNDLSQDNNLIKPERIKRKSMPGDTDVNHTQDKRPKPENGNDISLQFSVKTSNHFSELDNANHNDNENNRMIDDNASHEFPPLRMTSRKDRRAASNVKNNTNTNKPTVNITNPTNKPKVKDSMLPPIVVFNIDNKSLIEALNVLIHEKQYKIKIINSNRTHIFTSCIVDYKKVLEFLKHKNANNFSFTPKESKPINYIVKGIDLTFDNEDVKSSILEQCPKVNVLKISNLISQKSKERTNLRIIQVTPDSDLKSLLSIKFLLHQLVKWSRLRTTYTQCRNCQRPGHAASNCNMKYRCMKCLNDHEPGKCPRTEQLEIAKTKNDTDEINKLSQEVSCVNCGETGHPANYKKCKVYQAYINKIEIRNAKTRESLALKSKSYNNYTRMNQTYAKTLSQQIPNYYSNPQHGNKSSFQVNNNQTPRNDNFNFLQNECKELFGVSFFDLSAQINDFMPMYQSANSVKDKKIMLITFLFQLNAQCP